ncbi:hypothetical protein D3C78_1343340 [compost metagenome]
MLREVRRLSCRFTRSNVLQNPLFNHRACSQPKRINISQRVFDVRVWIPAPRQPYRVWAQVLPCIHIIIAMTVIMQPRLGIRILTRKPKIAGNLIFVVGRLLPQLGFTPSAQTVCPDHFPLLVEQFTWSTQVVGNDIMEFALFITGHRC